MTLESGFIIIWTDPDGSTATTGTRDYLSLRPTSAGIIQIGFESPPDLQYGWLIVSEVSAVPVPAAVWLFGSGLIGLIGVARQKKV